MAAFFSELQLWEKMTFVLGCVIGAIFCIGVGKLWWSGMRTRKQFIIDEENNEITQKMRQINLVAEARKTNQVPFGVRAIESGIEIDGIWISRSNTPVPECIRILRAGDRTSKSSMTINSASTISSPPLDAPQPRPHRVKSISGFELHQPHDISLSTESFPRPASIKIFEQGLAYKPKRSSQLRFSTYGDVQYHEETLGQLEGRLKPAMVPGHSAEPPPCFKWTDSSSDTGTDNNRSSDSSSENNGTVSRKGRAVKHDTPQYRPRYSKTLEESAIQARANASELIATIIPAIDSESFSARREEFPQDQTVRETPAFATPNLSPGFGQTSVSEEVPSPLSESRVPLLSSAEPPSPKRSMYEPGGLRMNKAVRKVNSNLEILPAATFGMRTEVIAMAVGEPRNIDHEFDVESSVNHPSPIARTRKSKKLQKKAPRSWIKSRVFGNMEHSN